MLAKLSPRASGAVGRVANEGAGPTAGLRSRGGEGFSAGPADPRRRYSCRPGRIEGGECMNVTCVQCENGKSISPIDSAQPTMAHAADTDSDLARPPDGTHPSARHATPAMLLRSATRRRTAGHVVAHSGPSDSE